MLCTGTSLGIDVHVYGPETHMTAVVGAALGKRALPDRAMPSTTTTQFLLPNAADSVGSTEINVCVLYDRANSIKLRQLLQKASNDGGSVRVASWLCCVVVVVLQSSLRACMC